MALYIHSIYAWKGAGLRDRHGRGKELGRKQDADKEEGGKEQAQS